MSDKNESKLFLEEKIAAIQKSTSTKFRLFQRFNEFLRQRCRWYYELRINPRYAGKDIDDQIMRIQNSTRTRIRRLQPAHDHLRQRFEWYYGWHLRPFSSTLHIVTAIAYTLSVTIFCFYFVYSSNPGTTSAKFGDPKTGYEKDQNQEHSNNNKENKDNKKADNGDETINPNLDEQPITHDPNIPEEETLAPPQIDTPEKPLSREDANEIQPGDPPINQSESTTPVPGIEEPDENNADSVNETIDNIESKPQQGIRDLESPNRDNRPTTTGQTIQTLTEISVETKNNVILLQPKQAVNQPPTANPVTTFAKSDRIIGLEIVYGTKKDKLDQTLPLPPTSQPQSISLPNLKPRTYYYQVITIRENGNKQYSDVNTLKNGNRFVRFFADKIDWIVDRVIGESSVISRTGLLP